MLIRLESIKDLPQKRFRTFILAEIPDPKDDAKFKFLNKEEEQCYLYVSSSPKAVYLYVEVTTEDLF